jgi:hypothetical protein
MTTSNFWTIENTLKEIERLHYRTPDDFGDDEEETARQYRESFDENDIEALWSAMSMAEHVAALARKMRTNLARMMADNIHKAGKVRLGEDFFSVGPKGQRKIADRDGLLDYINTYADWRQVISTSDTAIKFGEVKAIAAKLADSEGLEGDDLNNAVKAVVDTFYTYPNDQGWELKRLPMSKAPKYAQGLKHGERT